MKVTAIFLVVLILQVSTLAFDLVHGDEVPNPDIMTVLKKVLIRMDNMEMQFKSLNGKVDRIENQVKKISIDKKLLTLQKILNSTIDEKSKVMNGSLLQLLMMHQYEEQNKEQARDIPFKDLLWMTKKHDYGVTDDIKVVLEHFKKEVTAFENMWGSGSLKTLIKVFHQLDEEEKRSIWFDVIKRIKELNRLKFVGSPKKTTPINGEFGKDENGTFVTGFVNVKTDKEWHHIYNYKCSFPRGDFGDKEANVTCKDGGYSSGTFVRYETIWASPQLKYIEVVCTGQEDHLKDCAFEIHDKSHYLTNVEVKCYL